METTHDRHTITLPFADNDLARQPCGEHNGHLQRLAEILDVRINTRGTTIFVEGERALAELAENLLNQLYDHMGQERFVYRHRWSVGTLLLWDNRCLVHRATGGYEGHRRLLRRITISERTAQAAVAH